MVAADWGARGICVATLALAVPGVVFAWSAHLRESDRRKDERLVRDSAELAWWLEEPKAWSTRALIGVSVGPVLGLYVENHGASAHGLEVTLYRFQPRLEPLKYELLVVRRGAPVRCGDLDIRMPIHSIDWMVVVRWADNAGAHEQTWPIRHFGKP